MKCNYYPKSTFIEIYFYINMKTLYWVDIILRLSWATMTVLNDHNSLERPWMSYATMNVLSDHRCLERPWVPWANMAGLNDYGYHERPWMSWETMHGLSNHGCLERQWMSWATMDVYVTFEVELGCQSQSVWTQYIFSIGMLCFRNYYIQQRTLIFYSLSTVTTRVN